MMKRRLYSRIETWKKFLLDFGKRNRLINFKEGKRSSVRITCPDCGRLYLQIVDGRGIVFPYAGKVFSGDDGEEDYKEFEEGNVRTSRTIGDLQKTLKVLRYRSNACIEELGVNTLFLAFGLLKWTERDDSDVFLLSPLVLVPVRLTVASLASPYELTLHDDEIVVNPTLVYKFDNDFSIKLPEFDDSRHDIDGYLSAVDDIVRKKGWEVERSVHLTNLSFLKINMYKDLERNVDKLENHSIISAIADGHAPIPFADEFRDFDHDNGTRPIDTFQVVDADSSQQDAILLSKAGRSFVLQGPPGTGKSQTITNIISEALADGKKVLFVAEKMAALQVVYNRLSSVGLSDFCLTLHNQKISRKEILNELACSLSVDRKKVRDEVLYQLEVLERKRSELNAYQNELHTPCSALNKTVFEVNGELAKLARFPDYIFEVDGVDKVTGAELNERVYLLSELSKTFGSDVSAYAHNVWKGAKITYLSNALRHDIDATVNCILPVLGKIGVALSGCRDELGLPPRNSLAGLYETLDFLRVASQSTKTLKRWVYDKNVKEIRDGVSFHESLYGEVFSHRDAIVCDFDKEVLEIDYFPVLKRFRGDYSSAFRFFNSDYRRDIRFLSGFSHKGVRLDYKYALYLLNHLKLYRDGMERISDIQDSLGVLYGRYFLGERTDWAGICAALDFSISLQDLMGKMDVPSGLVARLCEDDETISYCKSCYSELTVLLEGIRKELDWFLSLFEDSDRFMELSLEDLSSRLAGCRDNKDLLEEWVDYNGNRKKCCEAGLYSYLQQIEDSSIRPDEIVPAYLKRFYRLWLDAVSSQFPSVMGFRGRIQEQTIGEFCRLDKGQFAIARSRVRERVLRRMPDVNSITSSMDEVGVLRRELNKQRKLMPLRKLFMSIPNLATTLKPCFMMSPLSVSVYLEANSYEFDLVIFDEASQVHTEDAIGAIMRGKQIIIVGDTKQLPPTNFFAASLNEDEYDSSSDDESDSNYLGAYDSILDEALAVLPERSLRWHYRSRHEHLIAFSNAKIYNHNLITFPSTIGKVPDWGVEYIYVPDGVYDRGGKKNNVEEAKRVAELVFAHFEKFPNRSLGVVTFSEAQQDAVDMAIRQKRLESDAFEQFFVEDKEEAFFIKNLENVQGDERDTIIFSIGYAKDNKGVMYMNFGPLSRDGGYRRLNVAITRAKYNVKLVGSILPTDIDVDKVSSEGVRMLRSYIEFAREGVVALQRELSYVDTPWFDSPFEEAVYDFLVSKGYEVITQVGCSGFRVDMAVKHPSRKGEFAIGIECDGATYHSSRTARERDRLRQGVLEDMGWRIYRIWSTDWIKNRKTSEERLIEAVERALCDENEVVLPDLVEDNIVDDVCVEDCGESENIEEQSEVWPFIFPKYEYADVNELSKLSVKEAIKRVVEVEQPIHIRELSRRVAFLYGCYKPSYLEGKMIFEVNYNMYDVLEMSVDFFVMMKDFKLVSPRWALPELRKVEDIYKLELQEALKIIVGRSVGILPNDLFTVTAKELGYTRPSANIKGALKKAYDDMLRNNVVKEVDGKVFLA